MRPFSQAHTAISTRLRRPSLPWMPDTWLLTVLRDAWVRVMWRCWQNGTTYDQALHGGGAQHLVDQQVAA
jgi:hypothetical protein